MDSPLISEAVFNEKKIILPRISQKKKSQICLNLRLLAEMVRFEPTCPVKDKTISSFSCFTVLGGR